MATIKLHQVPANVTITNVSDHVKAVQFFRNSAIVSLNPGDIMVIKVDTSAELAYFLQLVGADITVTSTAIAAATE